MKKVLPKDTGESPAKRLASYVPIFISVLALVTSVWSAYATRQHNKLSVMPSTEFERELVGTKSGRAGFAIDNSGIGPAFVSKLAVYLDGKQLDHWKDIYPKLPSRVETEWFWFRGSTTLKVGEKRPLYMLKYLPSADNSWIDELLEKRLFLTVESCSIYGDCRLVCSDVEAEQCRAEKAKWVRGSLGLMR